MYNEKYREFNTLIYDMVKLSSKYYGENAPNVVRVRRALNLLIKSDVRFPLTYSKDYVCSVRDHILSRNFRNAHKSVSDIDDIVESDEVSEVYNDILVLYDSMSLVDQGYVDDTLISMLKICDMTL